MTNLIPVRRALLSVSDKTDLVPFARSLVDQGVEIISTGGTHRALAESGIEPIPVEGLTGFPQMMDGRVKTLHPAVHGGILKHGTSSERPQEAAADAVNAAAAAKSNKLDAMPGRR